MKDVNWRKERVGIIKWHEERFGICWFHLLSKRDKMPIIPCRKVTVTLKFRYLEKQKVRRCRCFSKPWHWFPSPRRARRSPPLRNVPHWWWVSQLPWPPADRRPRCEEKSTVSLPPRHPWGPQALSLKEIPWGEKVTYFANHSIPHVVNFFAVLPVRHQVKVIGKLDGSGKLL